MGYIKEILSGSIVTGTMYQVVTGTITYNGVTYNSGNYFVGITGVTTYTIVGTNLVPTMTSDTTPVGNVIGDFTSTTYARWKAFDKLNRPYSATDEWMIAPFVGPVTIGYQFTSGQVVNSVAMVARNNSVATYGPRNFSIEASNDGASWNELFPPTFVDLPWAANSRHEYNFINTSAYTYYRVSITQNNEAANLALGELEFLFVGTTSVTEASYTNGTTIAFSNDFYTGLFADSSWFLGSSVGIQTLTFPPEVKYLVTLESNNVFITFSGTEGSIIASDKISINKSKIKELNKYEDSLVIIQVDNIITTFPYFTIVDPNTMTPFASLNNLYTHIISLINQ